MKIGIVSFYDTQQNYGQILQCFAMQRIFQTLGVESFHLRYSNIARSSKSYKIIRLVKVVLLGLFPGYLKNRLKNYKEGQHSRFSVTNNQPSIRGFDEFRKEYLKFSDKIYTVDQLFSSPPKADVWVTGSDQVWGNGESDLFQLKFAPKSTRKLAIAASMGGYKLDNSYQRHFFKRNLKNFQYISLRESDGVKECRDVGLDSAQQILDPTLLCNVGNYRKIEKAPKTVPDKPYVFVYLLGNPIDVKLSTIKDWIKSKDCKGVYVYSQGRCKEDDGIDASPEEWLWYLDHARYIITNSFHGMAFSILFNKQFIVIPIAGEWARMNSRLTSTLETLGIKRDRIFDGSFSEIDSVINYDQINSILNNYQEITYKKLLKHLK